MQSYKNIIGLLPSFTANLNQKDRFALWDAMDAAYRVGLGDAAEEMVKAMQSSKRLIDNLAAIVPSSDQ